VLLTEVWLEVAAWLEVTGWMMGAYSILTIFIVISLELGAHNMHTAWTKKSTTPDRQRSGSPPNSNPHNKGKGKAKDPPKSKEIRKLQVLADNVRRSAGNQRDSKGGCFCQGKLEPSLHNRVQNANIL